MCALQSEWENINRALVWCCWLAVAAHQWIICKWDLRKCTKPHSRLLGLSGEGGTCQRVHEYAFELESHAHIVERWEIIDSLYMLLSTLFFSVVIESLLCSLSELYSLFPTLSELRSVQMFEESCRYMMESNLNRTPFKYSSLFLSR